MGYKGKSTNAPKYAAKPLAVVDLHGMRVDEAVRVVSTCLGAAQTGDIYHIIVGKGLTRGVSMLGPAIKHLLHRLGHSWRPARLADGGEGVLVVVVR